MDISVILFDPAWPVRPAVAATIAPVPLVVELFVDAPFRNHRIVVVENSASLANDFGAEFDRSASSVQVIPGPDFAGQAAILCEQEGFTSQNLILAPGSYPDLTEMGFNDKARSIAVR
ncbi:MAG TPA: hypothetical protein VGS19_01855 [Streptosporangiaceae bacterium]|nr:hypothetical protein [Streptosporangiaceae bacterium]